MLHWKLFVLAFHVHIAAGENHRVKTAKENCLLLETSRVSSELDFGHIHLQKAGSGVQLSRSKSVPDGMMRVKKAIFENRCEHPVYLYGYQDSDPTYVKIEPRATEEFVEERGFLPWREQRITLSYGIFFDGLLRPTNLDAAVIELNADYLSWVVPKSHISFLGQLGFSNLNLELALWLDRINGTLAVETPANPACFSRAKTAFNVSECNFSDGSAKVISRTCGELCMPVCPDTGEASEAPCETSCFVEPGVPLKYPEEGGQQWSATFECWDFQTGPEGFPICDGYDPKSLPDELGVWQVVSCPDGEIDPPPVPNYSGGIQTTCQNLSDTCMEDLKWAMQVGIFQEPAWYPGLSHNSSADEFQALLHTVLGSCPPPCTNEPHFQAVDGAIGRVCRGLTPTDNANIYFTVRVANSTDQCKQLCRDYPGCKGIEFAIASGRCEIWLREGGILASNSMDGFECWRYVDPSGGSTLPNITTTLMPHRLMYFEGLDGGPTQDRVCRGGTIYDNRAEYFSVYWTSTLEGCKSQCVEISDCKGIEYASSFGRCEVWTRAEGIQAVKVSPDSECWIYAPPGTGVGTIDAW